MVIPLNHNSVAPWIAGGITRVERAKILDQFEIISQDPVLGDQMESFTADVLNAGAIIPLTGGDRVAVLTGISSGIFDLPLLRVAVPLIPGETDITALPQIAQLLTEQTEFVAAAYILRALDTVPDIHRTVVSNATAEVLLPLRGSRWSVPDVTDQVVTFLTGPAHGQEAAVVAAARPLLQARHQEDVDPDPVRTLSAVLRLPPGRRAAVVRATFPVTGDIFAEETIAHVLRSVRQETPHQVRRAVAATVRLCRRFLSSIHDPDGETRAELLITMSGVRPSARRELTRQVCRLLRGARVRREEPVLDTIERLRRIATTDGMRAVVTSALRRSDSPLQTAAARVAALDAVLREASDRRRARREEG